MHRFLFNKNVSLVIKMGQNGFKNRKQSSRQRTISGTKLCRMDTIRPAQCCFTELDILKAKILNNFKDKLSAAMFIKQHR